MPNVFGRDVTSIDAICHALRQHGDRVRGTYRARYTWEARSPERYYSAAALERPDSLRENPPGVVYPWEQIYVAAATCAGSDYAVLAEHRGITLHHVELVVEGVFDPRGEFEGLNGLEAAADTKHCFLSLHVRAALDSPAPREALEEIHARVLSHNMVLDALRGIPRTSELVVRAR